MIIEIVRRYESDGWIVDLAMPNSRPGRHIVEITEVEGSDGQESWCFGYSDDAGEAEHMYDLAVRTVQLVATGDCEHVDWVQAQPGDLPII
jgi:hypothetical protein